MTKLQRRFSSSEDFYDFYGTFIALSKSNACLVSASSIKGYYKKERNNSLTRWPSYTTSGEGIIQKHTTYSPNS